MADEIGLDLVEIAPEANPPVCKIMDFGKFKYEAAQKAREARQKKEWYNFGLHFYLPKTIIVAVHNCWEAFRKPKQVKIVS